MPFQLTRKILLPIVTFIALVPAAHAQDVYLGARLGFLDPLLSAHDIDSRSYELTFDENFVGGVFVGTYLGSGFRGELALDFLRFDVLQGTNESLDIDAATGGADAITLTANLWRDLPRIGPATPYVGLGVGLAWTSTDMTVFGEAGNPRANEFVEGDDLSAVGVVGAGLRFDLGPRVNLDLGYRFSSIINARSAQLINPFNTNDGPDYGLGQYTSHQVAAGLSYRFGDGDEMPAPEFYGPFYVGGYLGGAWTPDSHVSRSHGDGNSTVFDNVQTSFGFVIGSDIALNMRGELEVGFVRSEADFMVANPNRPYDGRFDQTFFLVNLWQDFGSGPFRAYAGGGLGFAWVNYDVDNYIHNTGDPPQFFDGASGVFAGQFGAGLRYDITRSLTLDLGYRMKGAIGAALTDSEVGGVENGRATFYSHNVQLGATYDFGVGDRTALPAGPGGDAYIGVALGTGFDTVGELIESTSHPVYFDPPISLSLAYGRRISEHARAELELGFSHMNGNETRDDNTNNPLVPVDGDVTQISFVSNIWADFDVGFVQPYVGGGLGMALVKPDFTYNNASEEYFGDFKPALALQVGFGVRRGLSERLTLDLGYRYRVAIDAFADEVLGASGLMDPGTVTYETHAVQAGLVWRLGE